ncbi:hypothetical protein OG230_14165 [Streptomyces sp. NBC_00234]|uniref:hypothetical protein n=1 Tax=Streptomyces sp. NBC_00234 TaxID=2903638 RepID=UPI002E2BC5ED|nr:hypothetical protein [Streptomyces sp. NBC_00234]
MNTSRRALIAGALLVLLGAAFAAGRWSGESGSLSASAAVAAEARAVDLADEFRSHTTDSTSSQHVTEIFLGAGGRGEAEVVVSVEPESAGQDERFWQNIDTRVRGFLREERKADFSAGYVISIHDESNGTVHTYAREG